jgi:uncharacterized protein DUF2505
MPTPFCFEHVFRAPSVAVAFEAYFDPTLQATQDRALDIVEREVLELVDTGDELRRVSRVVPHRQLPLFLRPLAPGPFHYMETARWRRRDDEIDLEVVPSLFKGRATISGLYRLSQHGDGGVHRRYSGTVSVDVALLAAKIERGIVREFERSMKLAAECSQAWLDARVRPGLMPENSGIIPV